MDLLQGLVLGLRNPEEGDEAGQEANTAVHKEHCGQPSTSQEVREDLQSKTILIVLPQGIGTSVFTKHALTELNNIVWDYKQNDGKEYWLCCDMLCVEALELY